MDLQDAVTTLKESESRLRIALEACQIGIFEWGVTLDLGLWENDRAYEIFGHSREDGPVGKERFLSEYLHPDDRASFETGLAAGMTPGSYFHTTCRIRRKDLVPRWVEMSGCLELDDEGTPLRLIGTLSDVTERKESEMEREQLALLVGASRELIWICSAEFEVLFINQAGLEMVGLNHRTALRTKALDYFFPEDASYVFGEFFPLALRQGHAEIEVRLRHFVTREPIWVVYRVLVLRDVHGKVTALTAMALNVTDRRATEEQLRISEERFRSYFDLGLVGMAITSPTQGILEVNDKICEILGYERSELLSIRWPDITHPDDLHADMIQFERMLERELDAYELEKRWIRKDNHIVHSVISVKCLRHDDGSVNYIVALLHDITERRREESNRSFMAEVNADFAHLSERREIVDVVCQKLLRHFNLSRCAFADIDEDHRLFINIHDCVQGVVPCFAPEYPMASWFDRRLADRLSAGEIVCVEDVRTDPSTVIGALNYEGTQIRSALAIPLLREGRWEFCLAVFRKEPSAWDSEEVELVRDFAVRIHLRLARADTDERLRQSEEHLQALVTQSIGGIAETDPTGRITLVNDRYCEIVGFTREELLGGMTVQSMAHTEDLGNILELLRTLLATGEPYQIERRYVRKDGSYVWVISSVSCIRGADGNPHSLIFVTVDIDERKQAEERLAKAHADLEERVQHRTVALSTANAALQRQIEERQVVERDREELMHRLVAAQEEESRRIARELHDDFAQRLAAIQMQVEMDSTGLGEITSMGRLSEQIGALSRDLRDLTHRLHPSILEDLGLELALKALVESTTLAQNLKAHLEIRQFPANLPLMSSTALYRIAQEALRNVVKHAGPGTSVNVELFSDRGTAQLSIRDTGRGFDLQRTRSNNGIGLATMRERARLAGGVLIVQAGPGKGTTVTAVLPCTGSDSIEVPRLVVCDDDPEIRSGSCKKSASQYDAPRHLYAATRRVGGRAVTP